MSDATCLIEGCEKPGPARGYCKPHYNRERRTGRLPRIERPTVCRAPACSATPRSWGYCKKHATRFERHGDPTFVMGGPEATAQRPNFVGDQASYRTLHSRLTKQRGPASSYTCVDCNGAARHWSYDHTDPDERVDSKTGAAYSVDLSRYAPRCASCHNVFDGRIKNLDGHPRWPAKSTS